VNHLHLNFEETLNDPTFKCLPCHEKCCCCKTECTINHRHCFTYIRTKKRYEKARQWKEKNRGEDGDGGSNSDLSEDGDMSGSGPNQNGMMNPVSIPPFYTITLKQHKILTRSGKHTTRYFFFFFFTFGFFVIDTF